MRNIVLNMLALSLSSFFSANLTANELRGEIDISLTIGEGCAVNGQVVSGVNKFGAVDFGEHSNLDMLIDADSSGATSSAIELTCNNDLAYSISLDLGLNASAGQRRVQRAGSDFVAYELYQDAARTVRWGTGGEAQAFTGNGNNQAIIIYGRVLAGQATPTAGVYSDTVRMSITW